MDKNVVWIAMWFSNASWRLVGVYSTQEAAEKAAESAWRKEGWGTFGTYGYEVDGPPVEDALLRG
jgi:hypothetical protein